MCIRDRPYLDLQTLVADKPVFVLTTNVDQQFFRVFPQEQICAFQGDFSYCQCSQPCRDDIWENRELVKELTGRLVGVRLPEEAVPRCPDCGRVLVPWVRDDTFLEGTFWQDNQMCIRDRVEVPGGEKVDERIYDPLMEMLEAAKEGNLDQLPMVVSGYRTQKKQQQLYDDKVAGYRKEGNSQSEAEELAKQGVSVPGYSEHQIGLSLIHL